MGEVYRPEDLRKKRERIPDLGPEPFPKPLTPLNLEDLAKEVRELRIEIERIKRVLKEKGVLP
ncbi:hypothetical protein [[Eubacterium] cellulosolvens]